MTSEKSVADNKSFLKSLVGKWKGTCRTWLQPHELADESQIEGEFQDVLNGLAIRHAYSSMFQDKPRVGEETIGFDSVRAVFQITWVDSFHMNYATMFSEGSSTERGFSVMGDYAVGPGEDTWSWRTEFELGDADQLTFTSYNVSPSGEEAKAAETQYARVNH